VYIFKLPEDKTFLLFLFKIIIYFNLFSLCVQSPRQNSSTTMVHYPIVCQGNNAGIIGLGNCLC
jgi:hypothetical protein